MVAAPPLTMPYTILKSNPDDPARGPVNRQYYFDDIDAMGRLRFDRLLDPPPTFHAELRPRARFTDMLDVPGLPGTLFVSERFRAHLARFEVGEHRFYPVLVRPAPRPTARLGGPAARAAAEEAEPVPYFLLHLPGTRSLEWVDWPASTFVVKGEYDWPVEIESIDDYHRLKASLSIVDMIVVKRLALNESFDRRLDLFRVVPLSGSFFASERLVRSLEGADFTGWETKPADVVLPG